MNREEEARFGAEAPKRITDGDLLQLWARSRDSRVRVAMAVRTRARVGNTGHARPRSDVVYTTSRANSISTADKGLFSTLDTEHNTRTMEAYQKTSDLISEFRES